MVTIKCEIDVDAVDLYDVKLKKGLDVTEHFSKVIPPPVKAKVIDKGNSEEDGRLPQFALTFHDEDMAWEFFSQIVSEEYDDFEVALEGVYKTC